MKYKVTCSKTVVKQWYFEIEAEHPDDAKEEAWDRVWAEDLVPDYEKTLDSDSWTSETKDAANQT